MWLIYTLYVLLCFQFELAEDDFFSNVQQIYKVERQQLYDLYGSPVELQNAMWGVVTKREYI